MLSVLYAIKKFRCYVYGTLFEVITDHSALTYLLNVKDLNGRLARWSIYLQSYTFKITHRSGTKHTNADALSRIVSGIEIVEQLNYQINVGNSMTHQ